MSAVREDSMWWTHVIDELPGKSSILFNSEDDTIFILDIPQSIAAAQVLPGNESPKRCLLSVRPLEKPYPLTEPKSQRAREQVLNHHLDRALHDEYAQLIQDALTTAINLYRHDRPYRDSAYKDFCLGRVVPEDNYEQPLRQPRKRECPSTTDNIRNRIASSSQAGAPPASTEIFRNETDTLKKVILACSDNDIEPDHHSDNECTYILPPRCTILLGDCTDTATFRSVAREFTRHGRFDMIVMDPPWPNRSAFRSARYNTTGLPGLTDMLLSMDLDIRLKSDGLVAVWITNRAAVRKAVLGTLGLFESWGVQLYEEWVWCKVTQRGEPMFRLDGDWRKPYEVCLIGRRLPSMNTALSEIKRRVIFGVPDLHSRKPCLKGLFDKLLFKDRDGEDDPAVLEIFARYAVAGWMSWGNEAIKYNNDDYWS